MAGLQFNWIGFDQIRKFVVSVCTETTISDTFPPTMILRPTVSVIWPMLFAE